MLLTVSTPHKQPRTCCACTDLLETRRLWHRLEVVNQVACAGPERAKEHCVAAALEQQQLIKLAEDGDGRLVDRRHNGHAHSADVAHHARNERGRARVEAAGGLVHELHTAAGP